MCLWFKTIRCQFESRSGLKNSVHGHFYIFIALVVGCYTLPISQVCVGNAKHYCRKMNKILKNKIKCNLFHQVIFNYYAKTAKYSFWTSWGKMQSENEHFHDGSTHRTVVIANQCMKRWRCVKIYRNNYFQRQFGA